MKILLISGHGAGDSGAVGCGLEEATLTRKATHLLEGMLGAYDVDVTRYNTSRNCYEDLKHGRSIDFSQYGCVVEVHFNAATAAAHGVEVLYRSEMSKPIAQKVSKTIAGFGFTNRGAKYRDDLMILNTCYRAGVKYILIETAFITNKSDMDNYAKHIDAIWKAVAQTLADSLGFKKLANAGGDAVTPKPVAIKKTYSGTWPVLPLKDDGYRYLAKGDKGVQVRRLQQFLKWYGTYKGNIDGMFGPQTRAAVIAFQKAQKLEQDGFFGVASLKKAQAVKK